MFLVLFRSTMNNDTYSSIVRRKFITISSGSGLIQWVKKMGWLSSQMMSRIMLVDNARE